MNIAKQFIDKVHRVVRRWEQQTSKNGNEEQSTIAVTHANGAQSGAVGPPPAGSFGTKSSSPPRSS